jgi:heme-degrading monooxygenase HmoA
MYARSTTLRTRPQGVDAGIGYVRDQVMPMVHGMDGSIGLSMLCDRNAGRCIVTTAWATREAMEASAEDVKASRALGAAIFGDPSPEVREWEIAVLHRVRQAPEGACDRVTWGRTDTARMTGMLEDFRLGLLPGIEELPGFCSVSMMVERDTGRAVTAVTYENRVAMEQAGGRARTLRKEFHQATARTMTGAASFDLVLAHLRVPETV